MNGHAKNPPAAGLVGVDNVAHLLQVDVVLELARLLLFLHVEEVVLQVISTSPTCTQRKERVGLGYAENRS